MAIFYVNIFFNPASPVPSGGYTVGYRIVGSGSPYTEFTVSYSPATFTRAGFDTSYEGYIKSTCDDGIPSSNSTWTSFGPTTTTTSSTSSTTTTTTTTLLDCALAGNASIV